MAKRLLFSGKDKDVDPMDQLADTIGIEARDIGRGLELCVVFSTMSGQGSGAEVIPVEDFPNYVESLSGFVTEPPPEVENIREVAFVAPSEVVKEDTKIRIVRKDKENPNSEILRKDLVWRGRGGPGSKYQVISPDWLVELVEMLSDVADKLPDFAEEYMKNNPTALNPRAPGARRGRKPKAATT